MGKMIDLSAYVPDTLDIKMPDGKLFCLPKVSERMYLYLQALANEVENGEKTEAIAQINRFCFEVLNSNTQGIVVDKKYVELLPLPIKNAVISNFNEFAFNLKSNPNL